MSKKKFSASISGKGYYIALILCAAAIGISGYLYYRNANEPAQNNPSASLNGDDVQAVATEPTQKDPTEETDPSSLPQKPGKLLAPVAGEVIAEYAMDTLIYNQTTRDWRVHNGIDFAAQAGTPVVAAADGTVYAVYQDDAMGMTVVISHTGGYTTKYSALEEDLEVAAGDAVLAGQTIGYVGNSALLECAVGDHVHFTVTCNDKYVDPLAFITE